MKWFLLFTKRNFKKLSFILVLLIIPIITAALTLLANDGKAIRVGYCCDGTEKNSTKELFQTFNSESGIIEFVYHDSLDEGNDSLVSGKTDILWIFPEDIEESSKEHFSSSKEKVVKIIQREDNAISTLAREKLFCIIYPYVSHALFVDYMIEEIPDAKHLGEEQLNEYYGYMGIDSDIIETVTVDDRGVVENSTNGFLLSPIHGILSTVIMLSGLAAAMYTLSDIRRGLFSVFSPLKRTVLCFASVISAVLPTTIAVLLTLVLTDMYGGWWDILRIIPFVTACVSLSVLLMGVLGTPERIGGVIPVFTVLSVVLSPVFMNINISIWIQGIFPTYHYLYSVGNTSHITMLVLYTLIAGTIGAVTVKNNY